jgi:sugar/nucleoside kinase (ribokinase family)
MIMSNFDVYIYGMTVLSTIHRVKSSFPAADGYGEILQTVVIPGGEGANAALVLQNWGIRTRLDGCLMGADTVGPLTQYLTARGVDCSRMTSRGDFPGWRDIVFCDGASRTVFGWFGDYFSSGETLWTEPDEASIRAARCVALDPFFLGASEQVAALCRQHGTPYVTVDCKWETALAQDARVLICSQEFIRNNYPGADPAWLFEQYRQMCGGLLIFTFGADGVWYGTLKARRKTIEAYPVPVADTLAAGDSFRAGVVYGLLQALPDEELVRFATATAAVVCTRFPSVAEPPTLDEIRKLMNGDKFLAK